MTRHRGLDLPDDDADAIAELTGGWNRSRDVVDRRLQRSPRVRRTCPPSLYKDRDFAQLLLEAVARHGPIVDQVIAAEKALSDKIQGMVMSGEITGVDDIPEEIVVLGLLNKIRDARSPTAQMSAIKELAELKGMKKHVNADEGTLEERISSLLAGVRDRREEKRPKLAE